MKKYFPIIPLTMDKINTFRFSKREMKKNFSTMPQSYYGLAIFKSLKHRILPKIFTSTMLLNGWEEGGNTKLNKLDFAS